MFTSNVLTTHWQPAAENTENTIIVLHGRGDSMEGFTWMPSTLALPANYLFVNAPDPYYTGYSWYDLAPNQAPGIVRSRKLLDQLFAELKTHGIKFAHTVLFGFSQGCLMTLEWGLRSQYRLAGYIGISGFCFDPEKLFDELGPHAKQTPILVTHGYHDEVLPFSHTESQISWLKQKGLNINWKAYEKSHTIDPKQEIEDLREFFLACFEAAS